MCHTTGCSNLAKIQPMTKYNAPAGNRTRGPTMATLDFATKPLVPCTYRKIANTQSHYIEHTYS